MAIDRLPVMSDITRILADEIWLHLPDRLGTGSGSPLSHRLPKPDHSRISMNLEKEPARLDQKSLKPGYFDALAPGYAAWRLGNRRGRGIFSHFSDRGSRRIFSGCQTDRGSNGGFQQ